MKLRKGKIDVNVLDRSVSRKIKKDSLGISVHGMSSETVSYGTSRIGELAVCKAFNALAADMRADFFAGADTGADGSGPQSFSVSFRPSILLPEGFMECQLREIMDQICGTCRRENLKIEGGYTEVTSAVTRPVITGSCTFVRTDSGTSEENITDHNMPEENINISENYIVMTKWAGLAGTYLLACDRETGLRKRFPESILARMKLLGEAMSIREEISAQKCRQLYVQNISEGGVFAALWSLSAKTGRGFSVDLRKIPVLQETIETADYYDLNPYQTDSTGSLLIVTKEPGRLITELEEIHVPAAVIGRLTSDNDKKILNGGEVRYLDRPQPDELLRIYG